ncbi:MAG: T9SS type A sorting domain-containing protein, partial [Cyclobacteriaceae bacterium]|nr:T9SS type A sorting domain-containing protein [Cyclobacteriaceae bacterium]
SNGCSNSSVKVVTVALPPAINVGSNLTVCTGSGLVDLNIVSSLSGGTWSGPSTTNGFFDPLTAGVGNNLLTYVFNNGQGCISTSTKTVIVRSNPSVNAGADLNICINSTPYNLSTQTVPIGGTWAGIGITNNVNFSPSAAGIGTQLLRYTFTDLYGCTVTDNILASVKATPLVDAGPNLSVCSTASPVNLNLTAFPASGIWSGPSVSGNLFNPSFGVGSYVIGYSFTNLDGCTSNDSRTVAVVLPPAVNIGANRILCVNSARVDLDIGISPVGGSWSGSTGLEGSFFNPALAGVGTYIVTYTYSGGQGCISTASKTIQVRNSITVSAGASRSFCKNSGAYNMANDPSLLGGSWSGNGVSGNNFNASTAGVGVHIITYTYADEFGCVATSTRTFTVSDVIAVSAGPAITLCISAAPLSLASSGFPLGGSWSGQGIASGIFNASAVGAGVYLATYSYSDTNGCTGSSTKQITVTNPPVVGAGSNFEICINAAPFALAGGTPLGGSWSGPGIVSGVFDPLAVGLGSKVLTYTYTDGNSCTQSSSITANVLAQPVLAIGGDISVCVDVTPINLMNDASIKGGVFSGIGITGSIFNPSTAKVGTHVVTYTLRYNGCELTAFRNITVNGSQNLIIGGNKTLCLQGDDYDLVTDLNVVGGKFTGNGISGTLFRPLVAGVGSHVLTYSYTNGFGCVSSAFRVFTVQGQLPINAGDDITICNNVGLFDLVGRGTPAGGIYVGVGIVNNAFNPSITGLGTFDIDYVVDNGNGCVSNDKIKITVKPSSISNFGKDSIVCINAVPIPLNFSRELEPGTWSGSGVVANVYYPSLAGIGSTTLTYSNSALQCTIGGQRKMTVVGLPKNATSDLRTISACQGAFITLKSQVDASDRSNNVTIGWYKDGQSVPFDRGEEVSYEVLRTERVYYKSINQYGCNSGQPDYISLQTNNPTAVIQSSERKIGFGKPVQFFAGSARNAVSYAWDFGNGVISDEKNPWQYYYESGFFDITLKLKSAAGCESVIKEVKFLEVFPESKRDGIVLGLENPTSESETSITSIYPNPVQKDLTVVLRSKHNVFYDIKLIDMAGQSIDFGKEFLSKGENKFVMDVSNYSAGLYYVKLVGPGVVLTFKFIKL